MQPIMKTKDGTIRFKSNKIVKSLLDNGGIDLNKLSLLEFSQYDREQFAQLIGYSISGYSDLSYVSDESYEKAIKQMISIRKNVLETNSSSTHSLTMFSEDEYDNWKKGLILLNWKDEFISAEKVIEELFNDEFNDFKKLSIEEKTLFLKERSTTLSENDFYTFNEFENRFDDYEHFYKEFKTKSGEKVVSFGYYGYS